MPLTRLNFRQVALLIFCTALVARLLFCVGFQTWRFQERWQFGQEIGRIGRFVVETREFAAEQGRPTAKFPPVYPVIVASAFGLLGVYSTPSALMLFLFQSICAALAALCLVALGTRLFNKTAGLVAGFGWALYPSSHFQSTAVVWYSELSILLVLLLIMLATTPAPARPIFQMALIGGLSGLLVLTDSSMVSYAIVVPIWALVIWRIPRRVWMRPLVAWSLAGVAVLSPWAIRNWTLFGSPNVLKSNFGMELFFGNNPFSSGGTLDPERNRALAALPQDELARAKSGPEDAYFALLHREAVAWIRSHPVEFMRLTAIRCWNYWGKFPSSGPDRWRHYSWFHLAWYVPAALLAFIGLRDRSRWSKPLLLCLAFLVIYPLPYYITHVQLYRYRYPVEPLVVLLAAAPVAAWLARRPGWPESPVH